LRRLFESRKEFAALPCYRDDGRTLEAVIAERLRAGGVQTSSDVIRFIAAHEGADRQVTLQEMDKIVLYLGEEKRLTLETAQLLAAQNDYLSQDDLSAALAGGDVAKLQSCLARSLAEGVSPVAVCRALQRYFQRMLSLHAAAAQGVPLEDAIARLRPPVFFKYVQPLKSHMRRFSPREVKRALSLLLAVERALKSSPLAPNLLLSQALTEIALLPEGKRAA
jgi:DNA polymerase-3 subunit delta